MEESVLFPFKKTHVKLVTVLIETRVIRGFPVFHISSPGFGTSTKTVVFNI
jgi:hypothetical protein